MRNHDNSNKVVDKTNWANATYETKPSKLPKMEQFILRCLRAKQTGSIESKPGYGKTETLRSMFRPGGALEHMDLVSFDGPSLTPEDVTMDAPRLVIGENGEEEIVLSPALFADLQPKYNSDGTMRPKVLAFDDPNQSVNKAAHNVQLQMMHDRSVNSVDLKANGVVGVFVLNNDSLADTNSITTDLAALDRVLTITLSPNDTGWRWALAEKYKDTDLTEAYKVWDSMPIEIRDEVSPRVFDHILQVLLLGLPGKVGLPIKPNGQYRMLASIDGDTVTDRTDEFLSRVASAIGAPNPERVDNVVPRAVKAAIDKNLTVLIQGPPGGGKTGLVKDTVDEVLGLNNAGAYYMSAPTMDPERFAFPFPKDGTIHQVVTEMFRTPDRKVIIVDEANRAGQAVQSRIMPLFQNHEVAGQPIPGCEAVIAIENPPVYGGRKMSVQKRNRAQSERFTINIILDREDINSGEWLLHQFPKNWAQDELDWKTLMGETIDDQDAETVRSSAEADARHIAEIVLEWWKNDIDDEGRDWVSNRGLERMMRTILADGDPEEALVSLGQGERAPVVTAGLRARLKDRPLTGLKQVIADLDTWIARLDVPKSQAAAAVEHANVVQNALQNSELSQLGEHRDAVVEIMSYMPRSHTLAHMKKSTADRQSFWVKVIIEAGNLRKAREAVNA